MGRQPMSHSQHTNHPKAMPQPAPDIIDLVSDSSDSDNDCIMLDSPPSPFERRDGPQDEYQDEHEDEPQHKPPSADLPCPQSQNIEAQSQTKPGEEREEVKIETLKLQSVLVKPMKRAGRTIQQQFQHPQTFARRLEEDNPEFTFAVENFYVIWEFCVCREKKGIDRTELKQSFPHLDHKGLEREFEKQVKEVISLIKTRRTKTWEERFTLHVAHMEGVVKGALKRGNVETANRIVMLVHKRAKKGGFAVPKSSILNDPALTAPIIPTTKTSLGSPSRILRRSKRLAANAAPVAQSSNFSRQMDFLEAANRNGIRCSAPAQTPVLVSAGEYYKDPGIGLGGVGGMSGLEAMSALGVGREASFHGFVEGEVDEDENMKIEIEGQELPKGIDQHDRV